MRHIGLPIERLPDDALLEGFGRGDEELSVAFVRRFQSKVFGVALAVCGDVGTAEDVAQLAFERAWKHAAAYDPRRAGVGTWLATITRNAGIDTIRRRRPTPIDPTDVLLALLVAGTDGPEQVAMRSEVSGELAAALRGLPEPQARCLVLAAIRGMTAAEIAAAEEIPLGTAKTRIRAAMSKVRDAMAVSLPVSFPAYPTNGGDGR